MKHEKTLKENTHLSVASPPMFTSSILLFYRPVFCRFPWNPDYYKQSILGGFKANDILGKPILYLSY